MKLNKDFIVYDAEKETILVSTAAASFTGIVRGNRTLSAILELLKNDTDEAAMIKALQDRFDAPAEVIEEDVKKALAELRKIGAIEE